MFLEASQILEILNIESIIIVLSLEQISKTLIRLRGCKGRSASLLFAFAITLEPGQEKMCLMSYANNKGADQPAHPRSLLFAA